MEDEKEIFNEMESKMNKTSFKRILSEKLGKTSDECKAQYGDQNSCDVDSECTWCTSKAVKSSCFNTEDAAKLPGAVFICDKKQKEMNFNQMIFGGM